MQTSSQHKSPRFNPIYYSGCIFAFFLVVQHLLVLISCLLFPNTGISAVAATIDVPLHRKAIIRSSKRSNIILVGAKHCLHQNDVWHQFFVWSVHPALVANCFTEALPPVDFFCCLLCSSHNEGTTVLAMGAKWDDVTMNVIVSFFLCVLLIQ
jgi:hypothetical protein